MVKGKALSAYTAMQLVDIVGGLTARVVNGLLHALGAAATMHAR